MPAYQDPFFPKADPEPVEDDWAKYLCKESMEELMKEDAEEEKAAESRVIESPVWGLVDKPFICNSHESVIVNVESPRESGTVGPVVESESAVVGPVVDVTPSLINKMNDDFAYSFVSDGHESTDLSEDLPTEFKQDRKSVV